MQEHASAMGGRPSRATGSAGSGSVAALVHGLGANAANPGGPVRALGVAHAIPEVVAGLLARRTTRS